MRFWAFSASQPCVDACCWEVWPDFTTRVPSSIFGCSTSIAPSKNGVEFASSGEPAMSSTLYGPSPLRSARPSSSAWPCSCPTLKLSNASYTSTASVFSSSRS